MNSLQNSLNFNISSSFLIPIKNNQKNQAFDLTEEDNNINYDDQLSDILIEDNESDFYSNLDSDQSQDASETFPGYAALESLATPTFTENADSYSRQLTAEYKHPQKAYLSYLEKNENLLNNTALIGTGNFKFIYHKKINLKNRIKSIAIATLKNKSNIQNINNRILNHEIKILTVLSNLNITSIIPIYGILNSQDNLFIISKLCNQGSLQKIFKFHDYKTKIKSLIDCWNAVSALHACGFTHRDVKASNFLQHRSQKGELKSYLTDFGLCTPTEDFPIGKMGWNAAVIDPYTHKKFSDLKECTEEVSMNDFIFMSDPKIDSWAFGMMICNLFRMPFLGLSFNADNGNEIPTGDVTGNWIHTTEKNSPEKSQQIINNFIAETPFINCLDLKHLVYRMMAYDPKDRPSDQEVSQELSKIYAERCI